MVNKELY